MIGISSLRTTLFAVLMFVLNVWSPAIAATEEGDLFPLSAKSWWTYKETDYNGKIAQVKYAVKETKADKGGKSIIKVSTVGSSVTKSKFYSKQGSFTRLERMETSGTPPSETSFVPAKLVIDSKIRPGSIWQWSKQRDNPNAESERWQVLTSEKLKVPAGEFTCVRIAGMKVQGKLMVYQTRWFAPNVGLVKSVDVKEGKKATQELSAFHVN